eukprot:NODE_7_length_67686_cov_1.621421.p61 type:complete len:101 gc:universal NODE_7_length_67686_cov_1.621421:39256-38954(-)
MEGLKATLPLTTMTTMVPWSSISIKLVNSSNSLVKHIISNAFPVFLSIATTFNPSSRAIFCLLMVKIASVPLFTSTVILVLFLWSMTLFCFWLKIDSSSL